MYNIKFDTKIYRIYIWPKMVNRNLCKKIVGPKYLIKYKSLNSNATSINIFKNLINNIKILILKKIPNECH